MADLFAHRTAVFSDLLALSPVASCIIQHIALFL